RGQLLRDGARVVLAGKPNAGKSSLFNRLLGHERAIVAEEPGTTRDALESLVEIAGLPLTVIDTAGLRAAAGEIERLGIVRTEREITQAALVVVCVPGSEPWGERDDAVWHVVCDTRPLIALTKSDLPAVLTPDSLRERTGCEVISTSSVTGEGIESLVAAIGRRLLEGGDEAEEAGDPLITSERHLEALRHALNALGSALRSLTDPPALELVAADLRASLTPLDQILGLELGDEVLDRIFARFCIGK
ncbi:MAG: GTP-binding protein, partial [Planctomycetaceae bacterium]|nr:GTP-binding protein [Planctomycetaceae bacterium]